MTGVGDGSSRKIFPSTDFILILNNLFFVFTFVIHSEIILVAHFMLSMQFNSRESVKRKKSVLDYVSVKRASSS